MMVMAASRPPALTIAALQDSMRYHARYSLGRAWEALSPRDLFAAVGLAVRERLVDRMLATAARYRACDAKCLYYLSMEFLMGQSLSNNLYNLGILEVCEQALAGLGVNLQKILDSEPDAALGNGGLGRLAACFLDSLATLGMPGYGYGINYEYGLFTQEIDDGHQREKPDNWLAHGTPWQIERPHAACLVPVYGWVEHSVDRQERYNPMWMGWKIIVGVPYDMPIVGYGGETVNFLRLFSARASQEFDMQIFNEGDYFRAVEQKIASETISKVLYPADSGTMGRELRLIQEYFLVACAIRDIVRRYLRAHTTFDHFPAKVAVQLNDTHPALTVAELMRVLVDEQALPWQVAWDITQATLGYTNHTLMPEALEQWPVDLMERVLPRHLQIIYEVNWHFLEKVRRFWPGDPTRVQRLSLIDESSPRRVRMAHLAIVGSHSVNGVSALHTDLLKSSLLPDFYALWPQRFNNKTNGVTPRRWLLKANPLLSDLLTQTLGKGWITDLGLLRGLECQAHNAAFQQQFMHIKRANKARLAQVIRDITQISVDPESLFDVHVKRIHEYKRQLLNVLHIIHEYVTAIEDGQLPAIPKTYIFAGKAAPGYWAAKQIIKLINDVGRVINNEPRVKGRIKVVFIPDYRVSLAEKIIPAADVSEQISTAGTEASGTSNMKFAMNGALTIGTFDGANIEIQQAVGEENIFLFGLRAEAIDDLRRRDAYRPDALYHASPDLRRVLNCLRSDLFCPDEPGLWRGLYQHLLSGGDPYFHLADFHTYIATHRRVEEAFQRPASWAQRTILNVARMGAFSSDRTISEYAEQIWHLKAVAPDNRRLDASDLTPPAP